MPKLFWSIRQPSPAPTNLAPSPRPAPPCPFPLFFLSKKKKMATHGLSPTYKATIWESLHSNAQSTRFEVGWRAKLTHTHKGLDSLSHAWIIHFDYNHLNKRCAHISLGLIFLNATPSPLLRGVTLCFIPRHYNLFSSD